MATSLTPTSVGHSPATRRQTLLASRSRLRSTCRNRCKQRAPAAHHAPAYTITSFLPSRERCTRPVAVGAKQPAVHASITDREPDGGCPDRAVFDKTSQDQ